MKFTLQLALVFCLLGQAFAQVIPGSGSSTGPTSVIIGQIQTATGGTIANGSLTFTLSQPAVVSGSATLTSQQTSCYTSSVQGNIVGLPDPLGLPVLSVNTASGTLPAATYYVKYYYIGAGGVSAVSPEASAILGSMGTLTVNLPNVQPLSATGLGVAISTTSGAETIQGTMSPINLYSQSVPLVVGGTPPPLNTSFCSLYLSDQLIPTGTYYSVNLTNKNGSLVAGFPQTWCTYGGAGATINVSNGAPTGNCNTNGVFYPTPLFANPPSGSQSMTGIFNLTGSLNVTGTVAGGTFSNSTLTNPTLTAPSFTAMCNNNPVGCKAQRFTMSCATSTAQLSSCSQAVLWTTAFPDGLYTVNCTLQGPNTGGGVGWLAFQNAAGFTIGWINYSSGFALSIATANCIAIHD